MSVYIAFWFSPASYPSPSSSPSLARSSELTFFYAFPDSLLFFFKKIQWLIHINLLKFSFPLSLIEFNIHTTVVWADSWCELIFLMLKTVMTYYEECCGFIVIWNIFCASLGAFCLQFYSSLLLSYWNSIWFLSILKWTGDCIILSSLST